MDSKLSDDRRPGLRVSFPEAKKSLPAAQVANLVWNLNAVYEITALRVLPGYEDAYIPSQLRPRFSSRLASPDQLRIQSVTYGSPLELFTTLEGSLSLVAMGGGAWGVLRAFPRFLTEMIAVRDGWKQRDTRDALQEESLRNLEAQRVNAQRSADDAHRLAELEIERLRMQVAGTQAEFPPEPEVVRQRQEAAARLRQSPAAQLARSWEYAEKDRLVEEPGYPEYPIELSSAAIEEGLERVADIAGEPIAQFEADDDA